MKNSNCCKSRRISEIFSHVKLPIFILICCGLLCSLVSSQDEFYMNGRFGKRKEPSPTFGIGSRYGRSGDSTASTGGVKHSQSYFKIVPRVDRFFYGSRYGKRTWLDPDKRFQNFNQLEEAFKYYEDIKRMNDNKNYRSYASTSS